MFRLTEPHTSYKMKKELWEATMRTWMSGPGSRRCSTAAASSVADLLSMIYIFFQRHIVLHSESFINLLMTRFVRTKLFYYSTPLSLSCCFRFLASNPDFVIILKWFIFWLHKIFPAWRHGMWLDWLLVSGTTIFVLIPRRSTRRGRLREWSDIVASICKHW